MAKVTIGTDQEICAVGVKRGLGHVWLMRGGGMVMMPSTLERERILGPPKVGAARVASPALRLSSWGKGGWLLGLETGACGLGRDKCVRQGMQRAKGRITGGPTFGLPPLPSGDAAAFICAVYSGDVIIFLHCGLLWEVFHPCSQQ